MPLQTEHSAWDAVATLADLPNVPGSPEQSLLLKPGHTCFVQATGNTMVCLSATYGAALWDHIATNEVTEYVIGLEGVHTGCDWLDPGNGSIVKAVLQSLSTSLSRRHLVIFRNGVYNFTFGNGDFTVGGTTDLVAESTRGVTFVAPTCNVATLTQFNALLFKLDEGATMRGIRVVANGSTVAALTGTVANTYRYTVRYANGCKFWDCDFVWTQGSGTYIPARALGDIFSSATIEGIEFHGCSISFELEGPLYTGDRHVEIGHHALDGVYEGSELCTNVYRGCTFSFRSDLAPHPDASDSCLDFWLAGGASFFDIKSFGNVVVNTRGGPQAGSFGGMEIDGWLADMRGWGGSFFQLSLIAGASDTEAYWSGAAIRNVTVIEDPDVAANIFSGWIEIVGLYSDSPDFVGTHILEPLFENIRIVGVVDPYRFDFVMGSTAPGSIRNAVATNIHCDDRGDVRFLIGNHYTPAVSIVPPRVQSIDGFTLDGVQIGRVQIYRNIGSTSANLSRFSIQGHTELSQFASDPAMTFLDVIDVDSTSKVDVWSHSVPAEHIQGVRRLVRATVPTATDDVTKGYRVGDEIRVDVDIYRCTSAAAGLATWVLWEAASSGSFTPVLTPVVNVASVALQANPHCVYQRIGKVTRCEMVVTVTPAAAGTHYFAIQPGSLPIEPAVQATDRNIGTTGTTYYASVPRGGVYIQGGTNQVRVICDSSGGSSPYDIFVQFSYVSP